RGDVLAHGEAALVRALRPLAERLDESAELVAVNARWDDGVLNRRVPAVDVLVRPADRRRADADQHLAGTRFGHRTVADFGAGDPVTRIRFNDCLHVHAQRRTSFSPSGDGRPELITAVAAPDGGGNGAAGLATPHRSDGRAG